jgi:hypothetical protein
LQKEAIKAITKINTFCVLPIEKPLRSRNLNKEKVKIKIARD